MASTSTPRPTQVIFFSHPRAACHLLERMLFSKQSNTHLGWHRFAITRPAQIQCFTEASIAAGIPNDIRLPYQAAVDQGNAQWEKDLHTPSRVLWRWGETCIVHEHPYFVIDLQRGLEYVTKEWNTEKSSDNYARNYTLFPEKVLLEAGTAVLLNIRHPALTAPGVYRGMSTLEHSMDKTNFILARHLGWPREMYDWYVSRGITPVVVDAEDYMSSQAFVRLLARRLGLSPDDCVFHWEKATEDEKAKMHPMFVKLQSTLLNSEGMVESKLIGNVDVEAEEKKWKEEWGDDMAKFIRETVDTSLPHYEYLRGKRLRLEESG